jgi:ATP-dependent DNA helicase RecG
MPEKQNIEWKESWRNEYLKWICGFANAKGGKIIIGKNDRGEVVGIDNFKRLMDDIPNKIQSHLGIICDVNLYNSENMHYIY